ncbi:inclusion membrane protein IncB [Chlamydia avium]|uniref:Inclusion membrane protein n=1 Tax=Chlamydia avium 10DC88 TaxID=1229831 RepID=W8JG86_9CHLA|nr:inclusion membrane protein IncB [Chlamydia avium]AHK63170.1 Putative inclusion membrane protein [Chlamydia avium 10DC88]
MSSPIGNSDSDSDSDSSTFNALVNFDKRICQAFQRLNELSLQTSSSNRSLSLQVEQALVSSSSVEHNLSLLKEKINKLTASLGAVTELLVELVETSSRPHQESSSHTVGYLIGRTTPNTCAKIMAVMITIIALISIAVLIACIVAACGGLPIFVSLLNMYTIGACISLPILACASVAVLILASLSVVSLLKGHHAIFTIKQNSDA